MKSNIKNSDDDGIVIDEEVDLDDSDEEEEDFPSESRVLHLGFQQETDSKANTHSFIPEITMNDAYVNYALRQDLEQFCVDEKDGLDNSQDTDEGYIAQKPPIRSRNLLDRCYQTLLNLPSFDSSSLPSEIMDKCVTRAQQKFYVCSGCNTRSLSKSGWESSGCWTDCKSHYHGFCPECTAHSSDPVPQMFILDNNWDHRCLFWTTTGLELRELVI
jgi:hypothetical protein